MRKMPNTPVYVAALVVTIALLSSSLLAAAPPPVPPDVTQSSTVDRTLTYNLGATGLRGWIYTKPADFFESVQGRTTTASRQILVTHVGEKSPADGVMKVDDVVHCRRQGPCLRPMAAQAFPLLGSVNPRPHWRPAGGCSVAGPAIAESTLCGGFLLQYSRVQSNPQELATDNRTKGAHHDDRLAMAPRTHRPGAGSAGRLRRR